jgi:hypothetical protein
MLYFSILLHCVITYVYKYRLQLGSWFLAQIREHVTQPQAPTRTQAYKQIRDIKRGAISQGLLIFNFSILNFERNKNN